MQTIILTLAFILVLGFALAIIVSLISSALNLAGIEGNWDDLRKHFKVAFQRLQTFYKRWA